METSHNRILLVLVGLPARGKSTVAYKLQAFLRWRGQYCETFNVGSTRRKKVKDIPQDASFFSSSNPQATETREQLAMTVLNEALDFLDHRNGDVAILDATNTTRRRRRTILDRVADRYRIIPSVPPTNGDENDRGPTMMDPPYSSPSTTGMAPSSPPRNSRQRYPPSVLFVESICTDPHVLESNMLQKVLNSPDYCNMPLAVALNDLRNRITEYEKVYEPVDDIEDTNSPLGSISYIKLIDLQSKVICRNISGALMFTVVSYLMVLHIGSRPIWLVRAGQCTDDAIRAMLRKTTTTINTATTSSPSSSSSSALSNGGTVTTQTVVSLSNSEGTATVAHGITNDSSASSSSSTLIASAQNTGIYQVVSALNSSLASSALSAGLSLNENGIAFRNMLSSFILRRVAGGRYAAPVTNTASDLTTSMKSTNNNTQINNRLSLSRKALSLSSMSIALGNASSLSLLRQDEASSSNNDNNNNTTKDNRKIENTTSSSNGTTATTNHSIAVKRLTQVDSIRPLRITMSTHNLLGSTTDTNYNPSSSGIKTIPNTPTDTLQSSVPGLPSMRITVPPLPPLYLSSSSDGIENSINNAVHNKNVTLTSNQDNSFVHSPTMNGSNTATVNRPTSMVKVRRVGHVTDGSGNTSGRNTPGASQTSRSRAQTIEITVNSRTATPMLTAATDSFTGSVSVTENVANVIETLSLQPNEEYLEPDDGVLVEQMNIPGHYHDSKDVLASVNTIGTIEDIDIFDDEPVIFCSTLPRTTQTADGLSAYFSTEPTTALNPMSTGIAMGVPLQHLREQFPEEWERFQNAPDRTRHRVTGGESLMDVVTRLQPLLMDVERIRRPVLLISHLSTLQVLYAYFKSIPLADCVNISIPMNCLIEFTPHQYGWIEKRYTFTKATTEETITSSYK